MKNKGWVILFIVVLLADLIAVYLGKEILRYATKPLLMPLLVIYFVSVVKFFVSSLKKWMILALAFSWLGDVLLIFESANSSFFIFGLVAFLIAHMLYIILFDQIRIKEKVKQSLFPLLPIAVYYFLLISLLQPTLGKMKKACRHLRAHHQYHAKLCN